MIRLFGKHSGDTFWPLLDQGAALVSSTLSFLLLGRTLGASGYGAYVGLYALIGLFLAPSQSGLLLAAMEHVVREREDPVEVARSSLSMTILSALVWVRAHRGDLHGDLRAGTLACGSCAPRSPSHVAKCSVSQKETIGNPRWPAITTPRARRSRLTSYLQRLRFASAHPLVAPARLPANRGIRAAPKSA